ncbi:heterokaryon incompatibility protein-domain-containing protein, partial [Podospora didyma]
GAELRLLPKAIQDAWRATHELGERFLWIDALCIQQDGPAELKRQLPLMDRIYNQSVPTMVALSGRHVDECLPGVRVHRPMIRPVEVASPWVFTGEMSTLDWVLGLTRYENRAWTLHEHILCKRRLFLSDWQVYFQCYQHVWQELYPHPRQIMRDPTNMELFGEDSAIVNFSYARLGGLSLLHVRNLQPWGGATLQNW